MAAQEAVEMLRALQSNDNNIRGAAEKKFSDARSAQPQATVSALFQVLAQAQLEEPVREQAAVLTRQCLSKLSDEGSTWSKLGEQGQTECRAQVLQLLEQEAQAKVRRKVADIVQSLGNQLIDIQDDERPTNIGPWPELLPCLMRLVMDTTKDAGLRADALWAVKELLTSIWQVMVANCQQTQMVLKSCLGDASLGVSANASGMLNELIDQLEEKTDRAIFAPLIPDLCNAVKRVAEGSDFDLTNKLLQSMEGTANSADFYKEAMATHILPLMATVAKSHSREDTRRLALEVIISFAEAKPKVISKVAGFIEQTLSICAGFLVELTDDIQAWAEEDDEDADDEEQFTNGKEVVDRLSRAMAKAEKFPMVLETLKPVVGTYLQSSDWKQVVAALTIISQIAEYIDDEATVTQMIASVKGQLQVANVRVRHAAWGAIAQLAEDHGELVTSETYAPQLLPEFLNALDDQCARVVARCMEAFQIYGQEVERELLEPFVQPMMEKLGKKLQANNLPMQRHSITFIAVLAGQVEDGFAQYYAPLMPVLKQIIGAVLHNADERMLLGKAFECVSLLAAAVGPARFRTDAEGIMSAMTQAAQVPGLPNNDPVKEYMMQASQRICWTMKADFLPFVPHILPGVLEKFTLAPKELNQDTKDQVDDDEEVNLSITQGDDGKVKVMVMSTSEMEDLQNAVECVHTFVEELGKLYAPFVAQTAQALLPVFEFSMAEEIRNLAFETWGELCRSAREGGQADSVTQLVHELLNRLLPKLEQSTDPDIEALKTRADGICAVLKKAGPGLLSAEQVAAVGRVAMKAMEESFKRREAAKATKKPSADEEEGGDDDEDDEPALRVSCSEMLGALMKHHPDIFVAQGLQLCMPVVQRLIQPDVEEADRKLAIFLVCDMLEHLGARVTSQWPHFIPLILQYVMHQSAEIRQPACFAVYLAAKMPEFAQFAVDSATNLVKVITDARSRAKKKSEKPAQAVADNALSALAQILTTHAQCIAATEAQMWSVWLQALPCQEDEEEGMRNHGMLLQLVETEKPAIVGEGGANLPHILSIFVDVYKSDMANKETSEGIGRLVLKIGEAKLEQLAGQLKDKQRKKLMRIHREAKQGSI